MPHYYFDHWFGREHIVDEEGGDHPDLDAARREAVRGARCIMSSEAKAGRLRLDQHFALRDADGSTVAELYFDEAIEIVPPGEHVRKGRPG